jgi:hypothetical protein
VEGLDVDGPASAAAKNEGFEKSGGGAFGVVVSTGAGGGTGVLGTLKLNEGVGDATANGGTGGGAAAGAWDGANEKGVLVAVSAGALGDARRFWLGPASAMKENEACSGAEGEGRGAGAGAGLLKSNENTDLDGAYMEGAVMGFKLLKTGTGGRGRGATATVAAPSIWIPTFPLTMSEYGRLPLLAVIDFQRRVYGASLLSFLS